MLSTRDPLQIERQPESKGIENVFYLYGSERKGGVVELIQTKQTLGENL